MLFIFHASLPLPNPKPVSPTLAVKPSPTDPVQRASTRSLGPGAGGRALRARPPAPGQGIHCNFDTRDNSFRVLSLPSDGGLSALFLPNRGGHAPLRPEQLPCPQTARRSHRKYYSVRPSFQTVGDMPLLGKSRRQPRRPNATRHFITRPFFHVSRPQRLSPLASIPAIRRITDADSVTEFAKLYLFSS